MYPLFTSSFALLLLFSLSHARELSSNFSIVPRDSFCKDKTSEIDIIAKRYAYLIKLKVTTHDTVETLATLDTGSDLIVLNGENCMGKSCHCNKSPCIKHETNDELLCKDQFCQGKEVSSTCSLSGEKELCHYERSYEDGFHIKGVLIHGRLSLPIIGSDSESVDTTFGVSCTSQGPLQINSVGIVGLGNGNPSLFRQLQCEKFSYCLPIYTSASTPPPGKLRFGSDVTISDKSTSLLQLNDECENHYCIHLNGIDVEGESSNDHNKIQVYHTHTSKDIMVIDTGFTFTSLNARLYKKFIKEVQDKIGHTDDHCSKKEHAIKFEEVSFEFDDSKNINYYGRCFKEEDAKKLKKVSFKFDDTTIDLKPDNFLDKVDDCRCLTIVENKNKDMEMNILGNRAQMNFKVAFDMDKMKVSFDEETCGIKENWESLVFEE